MFQKHSRYYKTLGYILLGLFCLRCFISIKALVEAFSLYDLFSYFGEAISVTTVLGIVYERWLWRIIPTKATPKLKSNYIGTVTPTNSRQPCQARLEIKQTLFSIKITLYTNESYSFSILADIQESGTFKKIVYCYENRPLATVRERSASHTGTAILRIDSPDLLIGDYFTDRLSSGDLYFKSVPNSYREEVEDEYNS